MVGNGSQWLSLPGIGATYERFLRGLVCLGGVRVCDLRREPGRILESRGIFRISELAFVRQAPCVSLDQVRFRANSAASCVVNRKHIAH